MENIGREPNTVHGTIHGPGYSGAGGIGAAFTGPRFASGFHTFRLDWAPNSPTWPGAPNSSTPMPNTIVVDYVRVTTL